MSEAQIFQILGLGYVVIAAAIGFATLTGRLTVAGFVSARTALYIAAGASLLLGLALLVGYGAWLAQWDMPTILAILGLVHTVDAVLLFAAPTLVRRMGLTETDGRMALLVAAAICGGLGVVMGYLGFVVMGSLIV